MYFDRSIPPKKWPASAVLLCIAVVVATLALLYSSYLCAHRRADTLIAKIQTPQAFQPNGTHFCFLRSITGRRGPCWEFSYDPNDFGVMDVTLTVSLTGEVLASNPVDFLPKLRSMP